MPSSSAEDLGLTTPPLSSSVNKIGSKNGGQGR
jgi:hypothetical protein